MINQNIMVILSLTLNFVASARSDPLRSDNSGKISLSPTRGVILFSDLRSKYDQVPSF